MISLTPRTLFIMTLSSLALSVQLFSPAITAAETSNVLDASYDCLIEPFLMASIGSPTQGIISHLFADRGAIVKSGQAIAQLESSMEEVAADQAQARSEMLGELVTREADLELAILDSNRFANLVVKGLAPTQQRDEALARVKIAKAALVQALENQKLLLLELDRAHRALDQRIIKSPIDGVIVNHLAFPGELVYDNPVMRVAQLDPLRVEVVLPARLFGLIQAGNMAQIYSEIETDEPLIARVDVVDPLLDSRSGTFGVRLLLNNKDLEIVAGQKCHVNFQFAGDKALLPAVLDASNDRTEPSALGAALPTNDDEAYELTH